MTNIIILGAGNVSREVIDIIDDINKQSIIYKILFLVEDIPKNNLIKGFKVIDSQQIINKINPSDTNLICAVGTPSRYKWINLFEKSGFKFITLIHPFSVISKFAIIGNGTIIYPSTFISTNVKIGRHVLILGNCSLMHDVEIGDYSTICSGVNIGGYVKIGAKTFVGIGSTIIDRVTIGEHSLIGAGSTVIENIPDNVVVVGSPARIIRENV